MGWSHGADIHGSDVVDDSDDVVQVWLKDHIGQHMRTKESIDLRQWIVVVAIGEQFGPKQVGYLAKRDGEKLATISEWNKIPRYDRPRILAEISKLAGWEVEALEYPI